MTLDKYEKLCPITRFVNNLDEKTNIIRYKDDVLLQEIKKSGNQTLIILGTMLIKNYNKLIICQNQKEQCCIYLNYWLDKQKDAYLKSNSDVEDLQLQLIEDLWDTFKLKNENNTYCQRNNENETIDKKEKRMNLMVYCKNRDHFKSKCDITRNNLHQHYCTNLPKYIEKHYKNFKANNNCLNIKNKVDDYSSYISKDCNLYDIHETFPQYDSFSGNILVNTNPRDSICKYVDNVAPKDSLEIIDKEVPEASSEELISAQAPWESLPYVGLAFVGLFLSFLYMYRYTTLGSSLRSLIIRKNKARQFIEEHIEQDLLENTLEYKTNNTENDDYTFFYQPLQN
ncbi:Plasmodium vivax Vir protein, putative [Plasmodium ovale]|uniref:Plasmodium vivax Vir protein, putative n=1 Tax=Plasmodium ovale TaxID=36330 RepID=A0A1C3KI32_PLAOA|nr:Plasmodium vivax Vir protein, putative [Plasmodium ovale]